ncbi:thioredoxin domain-containing protein [Dyadobacter sp. CY343]|uniref:thioredoxin domain-containing protein n=1 Tax=Dyadobacter sp. CY343 TaxID=2907299 RepID=UPI001F2493BA|nr:thioredoxin domain-containing protein [Dyadobacter sp. CY343]MCE7061779.1 thioredoxin domain-containing protein [Dyadobacter sp. CY343]
MKLLSAFTLLIGTAITTASAQTVLSPDEFERKILTNKEIQLLDVRTPEEYREGHLANSKNLNYKDADFRQQVNKLDKNRPVYVYCLSGGRSGAAAKTLAESGFAEVYDMKGGYIKWTSAGKKTEGSSESNTNKGMSKTKFQDLVSSEKVVLVDFFAPWCAPCQTMLPTIKKLTSEYKGQVKIETIDYDQNKALAKELKVEEVPTFLLYKNGQLISRKNGLLAESDFRKLLDSNL